MIIQNTSEISGLKDRLDALQNELMQSLSQEAQGIGVMLKQAVQSNLSGQILQSRTGTLLHSVNDNQDDDDSKVNVEISVDDSVPYAAILEYGGQTKAHIIEAAQAKTLAFMQAGKPAFLPYVLHPGSIIPEFAYMRGALEAMQNEISDRLTQAISQPLESVL